MTTARLAACPSCARHVRTDERRCPFCEAALPPSLRSTPAVETPAVRLSRAALYAVGVGALSLSSAQGCGSTAMPPYGAPPPPVDSGTGSGGDAATEDTGTAGPPDGSSEAASFPDAASPEASSLDGAPDAVIDVGGAPLYGAPPPRGPHSTEGGPP